MDNKRTTQRTTNRHACGDASSLLSGKLLWVAKPSLRDFAWSAKILQNYHVKLPKRLLAKTWVVLTRDACCHG